MSKNTRTMVTLSPRLDEMATAIQEFSGLPYQQDAIRNAIIAHYRQLFPAYKSRSSDSRRFPVETNTKICVTSYPEGLAGKIVGEGEDMKCEYYTYSRKVRHRQLVPVSVVEDSMLKNQYAPSYEKVKQLQKDKKVNYE